MCCKEFRLLVEIGICAARGVGVVAVQRRRQVARWNAKRGFHFHNRFPAVDQRD
ncbi:Uncharacterised protein [Mycobacterium tuberculosis]|nr:Uncharacterised protein [Mycobacterium tuberculosis]